MKKIFLFIIFFVGIFFSTIVYSDQTVNFKTKQGKTVSTTIDKIKPKSKIESKINVRLKNNVSENDKQNILSKLEKVKTKAVTTNVKNKINALKSKKAQTDAKKQAAKKNISVIKNSISKAKQTDQKVVGLKSQLESESKEVSAILADSKESIEAIKIINQEIIDNTKNELNSELSTEEKQTLETVDPNILFQLDEESYLPEDPENKNQWDIRALLIENPKLFSTNSAINKPIVVAVVDAGVDYKHPELNANMWSDINCVDDANIQIEGGCKYGYDFAESDSDPINSDGYDHGTAVASLIGALNDNNLGISSLSQNRVRIMSLRVAENGLINMDNLVRAIYFAVNNGAEIINLSLSGPTYSKSLLEALTYANSKNVLVVTSAGNIATNLDQNKMYPASYNLDNIIVVGSMDQNGAYSSFSNYGSNTVDIAAPGRDIWSATNNSGYSSHTGTSFSAPIVTALLAKWKSEGVDYINGIKNLKSNQSYLPKVRDGKTIVLSNLVNGVPVQTENISRYIKLESGKYLDMAAPGGEILDTLPDSLQTISGSSIIGANSGLYTFAEPISPGNENYYNAPEISKTGAILKWNINTSAFYTKVYLSEFDPATDKITIILNEENYSGYRDVSSLLVPGKTYLWNTGVTGKSKPLYKNEFNYSRLKVFKVSNPVSAPAAPTNLRPMYSQGPGISTFTNTLSVSWDPAPSAAYYRVIFRDLTTNILYDKTNYDNKAISTNFTIKNLIEGHKYRWSVYSVNSSGIASEVAGPSYFTYPVQNTYIPNPTTGISPINPPTTQADSLIKVSVIDKSGTPIPTKTIKIQAYNSLGAPVGLLKSYNTDSSGNISINKKDFDQLATSVKIYSEDERVCGAGICSGEKIETFVKNKTVSSTYKLQNTDITNYPVILVPGVMGSTIDNPFSLIPRLGAYTFPSTKTYDPKKLFIADAVGEWKVNIVGNVISIYSDFQNNSAQQLGWDLMIKKLEKNGYINGKTIIVCPYDWSADIPFVVNNYFKTCINKALANTNKGKVDIIAHSMGGLVTRAYIQESGKTNGKNIRKIAFLGTPHLGATEAYSVWATGYVEKNTFNSRSLILSSFYKDRGYSSPKITAQYQNLKIPLINTSVTLPTDINLTLFTNSYLSENPSVVYDFLRKENALGLKALVPVYPFLKKRVATSYSQTNCYENTFLKALDNLPVVGSAGCSNPDKNLSYSFKDFKSTLVSDVIETRMIYGSNSDNNTLTYLPVKTTKGTKLSQDGIISIDLSNTTQVAAYKSLGDKTVPNKSTKEYFENLGLGSKVQNVPSEHSVLPKFAQTQTLQFITGKTSLQELELSEIDTNKLNLSVPKGVSITLNQGSNIISPKFSNTTNTGKYYSFSNLGDTQYTLEIQNTTSYAIGISFEYTSGSTVNMATVYKEANNSSPVSFGLNSNAQVNQPMLILSLADAPSLEPLKSLLENNTPTQTTTTTTTNIATTTQVVNPKPTTTTTVPTQATETSTPTPVATTTKPVTNNTNTKVFSNISTPTKYYLATNVIATNYCRTNKYTKYIRYTTKDLQIPEKVCPNLFDQSTCKTIMQKKKVINNITCGK